MNIRRSNQFAGLEAIKTVLKKDDRIQCIHKKKQEENVMKIIRLKDEYPWCSADENIEVSDEVAEFFEQSKRDENNNRIKAMRHKAFYSLDAENGIEYDIMFFSAGPEEIYIRKSIKEELYRAISGLSDKQARRIRAHFFQGLSYVDIARTEDVDESSVRHSVERGLYQIKKII